MKRAEFKEGAVWEGKFLKKIWPRRCALAVTTVPWMCWEKTSTQARWARTPYEKSYLTHDFYEELSAEN